MAINANQDAISTIDEVVLDAFKKAGLLPIEFGIGSDVQWAAKAAHGRRTLGRLLTAHSTHRYFEYFVNIDVLALATGTSLYFLDADILNIIGDGSYIPASNAPEEEHTSGETPVRPISAARWNQLSAKSSNGTPTCYFLERHSETGQQLQLRIWPIPTEDGKIRFRSHRIPNASAISGSDDPDFKRHWELWAVKALAYELMVDGSMPLDACDRMKRDADELFEIIKSYDTNNTPPDVVLVHSTPWSNRRI